MIRSKPPVLLSTEKSVQQSDYEIYIHETFLPSLEHLFINQNQTENFKILDLQLVCGDDRKIFYTSRLLLAALSPLWKEAFSDSDIDLVSLPQEYTYENVLQFHRLILGAKFEEELFQQCNDLFDILSVDYSQKTSKMPISKSYFSKSVLVCGECDKEYVNEACFKSHMLLHEQFLKKVALKETKDNSNRPKRQVITPKRFEDSGMLELLKEDVSESVQKRRKVVLSCDHCNKTFSSKQTLDNHLKLHKDDRPFSCEFESCSKKFVCESHLKNHIKIHKNESNPTQCPHCDKTMTSSGNLQRHIRNRHFELSDKREFQCSQCVKKFKDPSALRMHEKIHTGKRSFVCSDCYKPFLTKTQLKIHMVGNLISILKVQKVNY